MANPDDALDDVFHPDGRLRLELFSEAALAVIRESLRQAHQTHWDCVRSPHVFMALVAIPDPGVRNWGERLEADLANILEQFQELFRQEEEEEQHAALALNREFLSDKVLRLLREAHQRAAYHHRSRLTPMDLLISLLTAQNSIVAECFERIGVTAAKLTELAVIAEHHAPPA
jgi:ATP-dependent Clp protease ATP-binding subunit ClpA